ncbi:hypothetical protein D9756_007927 [Leucocoprinus leucothites]|uniref:Uncharacterized protein n=1 Tax=Leucocoprinus leucothites TaxID=201217 RepID=A0A8H5D6T2_9AGAR|nr:hypothetical protein D9756_007927 [Leucoagaricus leucothites]
MPLGTLNIVLAALAGVLLILDIVMFVLWRRSQRLASAAKASARPFTIDGSTVGAPTPLPQDPLDSVPYSLSPCYSRESSFQQQYMLSTSQSQLHMPLPQTIELVTLPRSSLTPRIFAYEVPSASTSAEMLEYNLSMNGKRSLNSSPCSTPGNSRTCLIPQGSPHLRPLPEVSRHDSPTTIRPLPRTPLAPRSNGANVELSRFISIPPKD